MEPMAIAMTTGFSLIFVGIVVGCIRHCTKKPSMKPSRSDGDLANLQQEFVAQYA